MPEEIRAAWDARAAGKRAEGRWRAFKAYSRRTRNSRPSSAAATKRLAGWRRRWIGDGAAAAQAAAQPVATRQSSQAVLNALGPRLPELLGGSADLTGSNNTRIKGRGPLYAARSRPATTCTTACASSAWARS